MIEGRRKVAERAFMGEAVMLARTSEDALESAVRDYARLVYRIAYSVSRNHHDAEDATQETFLRVLRQRRKLESVRDPKLWLAKIAWRVAVGRNKNRPEVSFSEQETGEAALQLRSQLASAEETALRAALSGLLSSLVAALPDQLGDVVRLSTLEELVPAEIAEVLGVSEAAVRSRLFRARQILKQKLLALEGSYGTR